MAFEIYLSPPHMTGKEQAYLKMYSTRTGLPLWAHMSTDSKKKSRPIWARASTQRR